MTDALLPDDVRAFLRDHIWAHEHLEILLLLRAEPDRHWTSDEILLAARLPLPVVTPALEHLAARRLIVSSQAEIVTHRYDPNPVELDKMIERLGRAYRASPNTILTCLGADAIERVRTAAMRMFSDSFLIRRKRDG